jgi:hypothetical protein
MKLARFIINDNNRAEKEEDATKNKESERERKKNISQ